jgi:hypothetical protein
MDYFDLYTCESRHCEQTGILNHRPECISGVSEPTWVPCPACGSPMDMVRRAEEHEVGSLPVLTRYGRLGPILSIRTDGPAYEGTSCPSIDASTGNAIAPTAPPQPEDGDSDVIFTPKAAMLLKATESRTRCLARNGVIPAFKVGKKEWRYSKKALEEWVRNETIGSIGMPAPLPNPSRLKTSVKPKAVKKRKSLPTDLSPEALKKAIQRIRPAGE